MPDDVKYVGVEKCHEFDECEIQDCMGRWLDVWMTKTYVVVRPKGFKDEVYLNYDGIKMWASETPGGTQESIRVAPNKDLVLSTMTIYSRWRHEMEIEMGDFEPVPCPRAESIYPELKLKFYTNGDYMATQPTTGGPYVLYKRLTDAPVLSAEGNDASGWDYKVVASLAKPDDIYDEDSNPIKDVKVAMGLAWGEQHPDPQLLN